MPTHRELYNYLDSLIPKELSCSWDNDGLMCCSTPERTTKKVLVTLDITDSAIDYATENDFDVILSHHPLIFNGVKHLNTDDGVASRLITLVLNNISAMSFHTRLDAVDGGVNDALADALELSDIEPFKSEDIMLGRVGYLPYSMNAEELAFYIKDKLDAPYVNFNAVNNNIEKLAILGGAGKDDIAEAVKTGAEAYLTGELGHHPLTDSADYKITLIEAGHHYTEFPVCEVLSSMVKEKYPDITVEIFYNTNVKSI